MGDLDASQTNGAALNRARRASGVACDLDHVVTASTGPRSIERGERFDSAAFREVHPLQRGRAQSSAESEAGPQGQRRHDHASTGPRSIERGEER